MNLENFEHSHKGEWHHTVKNAYSMRLYLFKVIKAKAVTYRGNGDLDAKLERAAKEYDQIRGARSVSKYLKHLKAADTAVRRRQR